MASRDLTSAFIERRTATNRRRKSSGPSSPSKLKPFGEWIMILYSKGSTEDIK